MNTIETFESFGLYLGRMISGSKSGYCDWYPDNYVIFNANIITDEGKIWYGDIDVTFDANNLSQLAIALNIDLYILHEMDGRFECENEPVKTLKRKAVVIVEKSGNIKIIK